MQVMENKNYNTMKLNYSNSGIKTLIASSVIFLVFSILTALFLFIQCWNFATHFNKIKWEWVAFSAISLILGFFIFGLGYAIATNAEYALINKQIKERKLNEDE